MQNTTILLYEPDQDIAELLAYILGSDGYQIELIPECKIDSELLCKLSRLSLCLLDFKFKGEDCSDLCQQIKAYRPGIPVIALSCNFDIPKVYQKCGFDGFITKPFDIDELKASIRNFLGEI